MSKPRFEFPPRTDQAPVAKAVPEIADVFMKARRSSWEEFIGHEHTGNVGTVNGGRQ